MFKIFLVLKAKMLHTNKRSWELIIPKWLVVNGWQVEGLDIIRQHVQNINEDVDLFKVKVSDLPFHTKRSRVVGFMLRSPQKGIVVALGVAC